MHGSRSGEAPPTDAAQFPFPSTMYPVTSNTSVSGSDRESTLNGVNWKFVTTLPVRGGV